MVGLSRRQPVIPIAKRRSRCYPSGSRLLRIEAPRRVFGDT
jgi:hypothetical protein